MKKDAPIESDIMTAREVAEYLACHPATIYKILRKGRIPALRVGGGWRFRRSDIDEWIAQQQASPTSDGADGRAGRRRGPKR